MAILVGISFAVSVPFIFLAFNFDWIATPFHEARHVWLKKTLLLLLALLRVTHSHRLLMFGFRHSFVLERSIIEYENPQRALDGSFVRRQVKNLAKKWRLHEWDMVDKVTVLDDLANSSNEEWAAASIRLIEARSTLR